MFCCNPFSKWNLSLSCLKHFLIEQYQQVFYSNANPILYIPPRDIDLLLRSSFELLHLEFYQPVLSQLLMSLCTEGPQSRFYLDVLESDRFSVLWQRQQRCEAPGRERGTVPRNFPTRKEKWRAWSTERYSSPTNWKSSEPTAPLFLVYGNRRADPIPRRLHSFEGSRAVKEWRETCSCSPNSGRRKSPGPTKKDMGRLYHCLSPFSELSKDTYKDLPFDTLYLSPLSAACYRRYVYTAGRVETLFRKPRKDHS